MSNITPAGYIYGREPLQTNPFWETKPDKPDIDVNEVMALQDKRWLGLEAFPENYNLTIDVSKVENNTNYLEELKYAMYRKKIDYLTIENSTKGYLIIGTDTSGKVYTVKNSTLNNNMYIQNGDTFHKRIFDNCISKGSNVTLGSSVNMPGIVEINNFASSTGSPITLTCDSHTTAYPNSCILLKWDKGPSIYNLSYNYIQYFKNSQMTFFVEDSKLQTYLSNGNWAQLSSQIRPLSEFKEEEW